ncbi:MAG: Asp-tRNA(Asn)/Glu-tRNA(Gln) amidotransferase subunit GatA [Deltaproteobacteria bacterium]|nr:Asp-tRNA(Asn)/Glu-tRNA(Gln) amidotransferase subunit GatA [Deltaproteobacteria bacterium]
MLYSLTLTEILQMIEKKETNAREVFLSLKERIQEIEKHINAYITIFDEEPEEKGLLKGLPIAIKDNMCMKDKKTTCGSCMLENFVSPYNATVIEKLEKSGASFIGKTNMDEFAMGSSCETSYFGPTKNPWDINCIPGGSSGGSAAAVASGEAICALGSDTGGSIRQPAALCGVVGMKPTYGRISRYGLVAFASSLDQIGPITRTVEDTALLLNIICGKDERDSTSADIPVPDFKKALNKDIKGVKIGVYEEGLKDCSEAVKENFKKAEDVFTGLGAELVSINLPHLEYAVADYYIIAPAEASSNLARYDGVKYGFQQWKDDLMEMYKETRSSGFGNEVKRRILLGTYVLSSGYYDAYYLKAQKVRTLIKEDFDEAFKQVKAIISPTSPTETFKLGEKINDPLKMYLSDIFTIPANLAGLPAISVPMGLSKDSLPVGLQIMGGAFCEDEIISIAHAFERKTCFHKKIPIFKE